MLANRPEWNLYIIRCEDESLFVGITTNVEAKLHHRHVDWGGSGTLIYQEAVGSLSAALSRRVEIRDLSRQVKLGVI